MGKLGNKTLTYMNPGSGDNLEGLTLMNSFLESAYNQKSTVCLFLDKSKTSRQVELYLKSDSGEKNDVKTFSLWKGRFLLEK